MFERRTLLGMGIGSVLSPTVVLGQSARLARASGVFDIRHFGARGDGVTLDTASINAAIDAAAAVGGGTVYFPPGTYLSFTIRLRSFITLHLSPGAVLLAAPITSDAEGGYDEAEPIDASYASYQDFGHSHWRNSLIWGEKLTDIAIVGGGLIWGKGLTDGHPTEGYKPGDARRNAGNKAIGLKECRHVLLRDFKILEGGWFALLATGVDDLTIDNVLVDTARDGFDIDCCRDVRITNCTLNTPFDDAIVPKSSFALGHARPSENILISNCKLSGNYAVGSVLDGTYRRLPPGETMKIGRIKLGTESNGGFRNIAISNCVFDECRGIALETVDGGVLEDIAISNVTMRGCTNAPLFLRLGARLRGPAGIRPGVLRRVSINSVVSSGASPLPSIIAGVSGAPIEDIQISDCFFEHSGGGTAEMAKLVPAENDKGYPETELFGKVLPASGFFVRHARNVTLRNVEIAAIAPDRRPLLWLDSVNRFQALNLRHQGVTAPRLFRRRSVSNFSVG